ncbi:MAG TPA: PEP-CTERM sorting domain-containing protein [Tepidisphaeraceae bacterium]|nr:PEP-CTERM sorting domain-containing protein [Tepidisphaeraceae bacterium]
MKQLLVLAAAVAAVPATSFGAAYSDNFDTNTSANYTVNANPDTTVDWAWDYSTMGIPSAPNSVGGTTKGVKFTANNGDATAAAAAISISPTGYSVTGDYTLKFDAWINANGPFPAGGTGSTEYVTGGVGTTGTSVQSSATGTGAWFAVDGEGGASSTSADFRAYSNISLATAASGVYAAGIDSNSRDNGNTYYHATFPGGQKAPQFQQDNYPQQTGELAIGTVGFAWREFVVSKVGDDVTWSMDGLTIATLSNQTLSGSNISVGYWDVFSSISDNAALSFGVVDNLTVVVPEPTSLAALGLGGLGLLARRRRA